MSDEAVMETSPLTRAYYAQRKSELTGVIAATTVAIAIRKMATARGKYDRDGKSPAIEYAFISSLASAVTFYTLTKALRRRGW